MECICLYKTLRYKLELYIINAGIQIIEGQKYTEIQDNNIKLNLSNGFLLKLISKKKKQEEAELTKARFW